MLYPLYLSLFILSVFVMQANMKLNEQQLANLSSPKAVREFMAHQRDNIMKVIKQNLAVGDIFRRENLEVLTRSMLHSFGLASSVHKIIQFQNLKFQFLIGPRDPILQLNTLCQDEFCLLLLLTLI